MRPGKEKSGNEVSKDLLGDNYRIPLAAFISIISVSTLNLYKREISFGIFTMYFAFLMVGLFYITDLRKFLLRKYSKVFKDDDIFDILLYAVTPPLLLPMMILAAPETVIVFFPLILLISSFTLGITVRKRQLRKKHNS